MKLAYATVRFILVALFVALAPSCSTPSTPPRLPDATATFAPSPITAPTAAGGLTDEQAATLRSLQQVDSYPLYTLQYQGYLEARAVPPDTRAQLAPLWGCSLFATLGDPSHQLYGRNFDWTYSPAVLVFAQPPDGYASVSMVDLAYLFPDAPARDLTALPLVERKPLLSAPLLPFDGMNEYGLAIGMAAVPTSTGPQDPAKQTVGSLRIIREMLDHARTVDEATAIMSRYNVDMQGGPPIHYLIADRGGHAVLVEFAGGNMATIPNDTAWHIATNFVRSTAGGTGLGNCSRFDKMYQELASSQGILPRQAAIALLRDVSQSSTQWSVVYGQSTGDITVVMGNHHESPRSFHLDLVPR